VRGLLTSLRIAQRSQVRMCCKKAKILLEFLTTLMITDGSFFMEVRCRLRTQWWCFSRISSLTIRPYCKWRICRPVGSPLGLIVARLGKSTRMKANPRRSTQWRPRHAGCRFEDYGGATIGELNRCHEESTPTLNAFTGGAAHVVRCPFAVAHRQNHSIGEEAGGWRLCGVH
jgi:hypothetical protein